MINKLSGNKSDDCISLFKWQNKYWGSERESNMGSILSTLFGQSKLRRLEWNKGTFKLMLTLKHYF